MLEESIYNTKYHMLYFCNMFVFFLFVCRSGGFGYVCIRGVTVLFGLVFNQKNVWTEETFIGLNWFSFHCFSKKKPNQTNRFGLVRLIGLFKNTIKKKSYSHKIFHRTLYNCISYFVFSCSLFFKQLFITNLSQYFIHMIQDSFIHHSSKTTSSNSNISIIHDPYMHHSSINTKIPKRTS